MTERSVEHATIVIERTMDAPPARVFAAWTDPVARARWETTEGWEATYDAIDVRVGGRDIGRYGRKGEAPIYTTDARYEDIVPDQRIVYAYTMADGDKRISASLTTVEFRPDGGSTRLVLTEQIACLDGGDRPESREQGLRAQVESLAEEVRR